MAIICAMRIEVTFLKLIHRMTLVSPRLCKTKISLLCRFSSRPQDRSKISKITFKDLKTKLNANVFSFNPLTHSGHVHPYQLDESISTLRGECYTFSFFITFRMKIPVANSVDPDQTPRFAASNLRLHCWQKSQRWVAYLTEK